VTIVKSNLTKRRLTLTHTLTRHSLHLDTRPAESFQKVDNGRIL
jgi:hypothetical protein